MSGPSHVPDVDSLLVHEAFVRRLAASLVGSGGADDLAQDVWVAAIEGRAHREGPPRPWLAGIGRKLAAQRRRGDGRRRQREHAAAHDERVPSVLEIAEREAVRRQVVDAVLALAEPYRSVVLLRWFEGLPPRRIALRLQVPLPTVKTRLKRAVAQLRARLDHEHGADRKGWALPLLALARPRWTHGWPAWPALASGVLLMSTKIKMVAALVALAGLSVWAIARLDDGLPQGPPSAAVTGETGSTMQSASTVAPPTESGTDAMPARSAVAEAPSANPTAPTTGSLRVSVTWPDGTPAARVPIRAEPHWSTAERKPSSRDAITDASGSATFAALAPGGVMVVLAGRDAFASGLHVPGAWAEVVAGAEALATLHIAPGVDVDGVVVDGDDRPVAGATVLCAGWGCPDAAPIATTDADGHFATRALPTRGNVGAIADGYAPSPLEQLSGSEGGERSLRIVLPEEGAAVDLYLSGPDGLAVAGAAVQVRVPGSDPYQSIRLPNGHHGMPAPRRWTTTDAAGRAHLGGLSPGPLEIAAFAAGMGSASQRLTARAGATERVDLRLGAGAVVTGTVTTDDGRPVRGATIELGAHDDILRATTAADAQGHYRLDDLPAGELALRAHTQELGEVTTTLHAEPGEEKRWDAVLTRGLTLPGRVVADPDGKAIPNVMIEAHNDRHGSRWFRNLTTGDDGGFTLTGCEPDARILLRLRIGGSTPIDKGPFALDTSLLVVHVSADERPTCRIAGRVLAPDGTPAADVTVSTQRRGDNSATLNALDPEGRFDLGPFPPNDYRLTIASATLGTHITAWHTLAPSERWQLGDVRFERPGTVLVSAVGSDGTRVGGAMFWLSSEHAGRDEIPIQDGVGHSRPLAPGRYQLQIQGDGIASRIIPCDVQPGAEYRTDLTLQPGTPCALIVTLPQQQNDPLPIEIVTPDATAVFRAQAWPGVTRLDPSLAPGRYRLIAHTDDGSWNAEAPFEVPADGKRLRLELAPQ